MRAGRRLVRLGVLLGVLAATTAAALAATVSWGSAIEVPGSAALNVGGSAGVASVSCATVGNCVAGGGYAAGRNSPSNAPDDFEAFVVDETNGSWGSAIEVPGTAALNAFGDGGVDSVSCGGAGDCAAGGFYYGDGYFYGWVAAETNGVWGTAVEAPWKGGLDTGTVASVSCGSPGTCSAGGSYSPTTDKYGSPIDSEAFVVSETGGTWDAAHPLPVPGAGAFPRYRPYYSYVKSVSCAGAGDCVAGGSAQDSQAFVVAERNGKWGNGTLVQGMTALTGNRGRSAVDTVSCASPGNCTAGGWYVYGASPGRARLFVVAETNGKWGKAVRVRGMPAQNTSDFSLSCVSAGDCAGGGYYTDRAKKTQAFVVAERNGVWGTAIEVPGTAALNVGGDAAVSSVSCASAGNCAATGAYATGPHTRQAFVVREQGGVWGTAQEVPGTAALDVGHRSSASSISCVHAGSCAIGGSYSDGSDWQAFVTAP